jgi:guanylate kinase
MAYAQYDLINYEGPKSVPVDNEILATDGEVYNNVKLSLLKNTALAGLAGTIVADLARGTEDAVIYFAGATAGVLYLYFLGIKTDTVGSVDAKLGANVSNLRFVFPALVLIGVALNNVMSGNPELDGGLFSTVTPEQFGAAMIGFLTYRVPLLISHLFPVLFDSATDMLPGSTGMAIRMAAEAKKRGVDVSTLDEKRDDGLVTVLLVSGPEGTGKTTLVNKLIESDDRFVRPIMQDRVLDQMRFERMEERDEFLSVDESGRYGLSKDGVLQAATKAKGTPDEQKVVVLDAKVSLARKLSTMYEVRIVGVWVGLDSLEKFESRLKAKMQSGGIEIPEGQTEDSVLRAKVNQAIKDIEYGVTSGLFEFTILNEDIDESVKELKDAAGYCFK